VNAVPAPVVIVDYDPAWPAAFERERDLLRWVLGDLLLEVEHIGSTAVPGLDAKPIIDIMAAVGRLDDAEAAASLLERLGYEYAPELNAAIPERRFFRKRASGRRTHHLHIVEPNCDFWRRHLLFRDYLRAHPAAARCYARLKRELAGRCGDDLHRYTDAKTPFIREIEARARVWSCQDPIHPGDRGAGAGMVCGRRWVRWVRSMVADEDAVLALELKQFLKQVEEQLCKPLEEQNKRFPSAQRLLARFRSREWIDARRRGGACSNEVAEVVNEICLAHHLLFRCHARQLEYEPPLRDTGKTIDFCSCEGTGQIGYYDVKTIHPDGRDDWRKYVEHLDDGRLRPGLNLERDRCGGEIYHAMRASRAKMLAYTLELETKAATVEEDAIVLMVFCSNGDWYWHKSDLEDFVYFYHKGCHNPGDKFDLMERYYVESQGIQFSRRINGFLCLQRDSRSTEAKVCRVNPSAVKDGRELTQNGRSKMTHPGMRKLA